MYDKGLLLYHFNAGKEEKEEELAEIVKGLSGHVKQLTLYRTDKEGEGELICKERGEEYDILFVLGGDGTVHECINGLAALSHPPIISILPGGTCNDFSRMLNIPLDLWSAAQLSKDQTNVKKVDVGTIGDGYFLNFAGCGLITNVSENIDETVKKRAGTLSYFMSAIKTIQTVEPFTYELKVDDMTYDGEAIMILVMNGRFIGTREFPLMTVQEDDGKLDVLIVKNTGYTLWKEWVQRKSGWPENQDASEVLHLTGKSVQVTTIEEMNVDTDGEIYRKTPMEIGILPHKLSFVFGEEV